MSKIEIPHTRDAFDTEAVVSIRYSDQDPMGHVNNVAITAYLESGRTALLRHIFAQTPLPKRGMVLANLTVDYLHEILFPGEVVVCGRLTHFGTRSLTNDFAIFQGETCCVTSRSVNVFFDPEKRVATNPPDEIRKTMEAFLAGRK